MKKLILLFCIALFASCSSTIPIVTQSSDPNITWDGKTLCIGKSFSAQVDPAQLAQGIKFGNDVNYIIVKYKDGKLDAEGHGCYQLVK